MEQGLKTEINNFLNNYNVRFEPETKQWWVFVDYEVKGEKKKAYAVNNYNPAETPTVLKRLLKEVRTQIEDDFIGIKDGGLPRSISFIPSKKEVFFDLLDKYLTQFGNISVSVKQQGTNQLVNVSVND